MANNSAAELFSYPSSHSMVGLQMQKLYAHPEDRELMIQEIREKGKLINFELELRRKDGSCFWSLNNIKTFSDEKGNVLGTEGVIRDITNIRQTEENLKQANQQLLANAKQLKAAQEQSSGGKKGE